MINELYFCELFLVGVSFEICILEKNLVKDKILSFGDFQDFVELNSQIFNYIFEIFESLEYNIKDAILLSSGDMFGKSYYENNKKIIIKGSDGIPEYQLYKNIISNNNKLWKS